MKRYAIVYFIILLQLSVFSIAKSQEFSKMFSSDGVDIGYDVIETQDGNYLIGGTFSKQVSSSNWVNDGYLIKMDIDGDTLWTKTYGGNRNDFIISIVEASDGYFLLGNTVSYSDNNSSDILLIKVDFNGNEIWKKTYGGNSREQGNKLIQLSNNNLLIAGITESKGAGSLDAYLIKVNQSGEIIWENTYGGSEVDDAWDVIETSDNGFIFTGGTYSFSDGTLDDGWIVKVNSEGDELWKKTYGEQDQEDWFWAIEHAGNDEYVLTGLLNNNSNDPRTNGIHFIKVDENGDLIWDKSFGQGSGYQGNDIKKDSDGGYIIGGVRLGQTTFEFLFVKTNERGDTLWTKGYGNNFTLNRIFGLSVTSDGHYIGTGLANQTPDQDPDLFIVKLKSMVVGVDTQKEISFEVYPNPVKDILKIEDNAVGNANYQITDIKGQVIFEARAENSVNEFDISNFNNGTYFLTKITNDERETVKFIKE